jgi:glutamate synthase (NADPH/NADH) small chain
VPGGDVTLDIDLVLVAVGFTGVESDDPLYGQLGFDLGERDTVPVDATYATTSDGVFAAGDCVRGADLIVQAIADGREAARSADLALQGESALPSRVAV